MIASYTVTKKITGPKQPKNQDNDSNQKFCNQTKITKLFVFRSLLQMTHIIDDLVHKIIH